MEQAALWRRMAEKWREAADEVVEPALKRCYLERAATYKRLAARDETAAGRPSAELRDG